MGLGDCWGDRLDMHADPVARDTALVPELLNATRCDELAVNYLAAVCLAATVCYWLWVPGLTLAVIPGNGRGQVQLTHSRFDPRRVQVITSMSS